MTVEKSIFFLPLARCFIHPLLLLATSPKMPPPLSQLRSARTSSRHRADSFIRFARRQ
jgi:hypothetical protein